MERNQNFLCGHYVIRPISNQLGFAGVGAVSLTLSMNCMLLAVSKLVIFTFGVFELSRGELVLKMLRWSEGMRQKC